MLQVCFLSPTECALALPALRELRPASPVLTDAESSAAYLQSNDGSLLAGSFEGGRKEAASVAGYRILTNLAWGHFLHLDNLSTLPEARAKGHAAALLAWLDTEARRLGCAEVHLDSGSGSVRYSAHREYLKAGPDLTCHHFGKVLS